MLTAFRCTSHIEQGCMVYQNGGTIPNIGIAGEKYAVFRN